MKKLIYQTKSFTAKEDRKKAALLEELRYLTYDVPCNDWVIKRIIKIVSIVSEGEVVPEEYKYENFISRFYERHHIKYNHKV